MKDRFECDKCGACCKALIVEADWLDVAREPLIQSLQPERIIEPGDDSRAIMLYDSERRCCPFLTDNQCGIYKSRPTECVCVQAGDAKCQQARAITGMPLLNTISGEEPDLSQLESSCIDYDLDLHEDILSQLKSVN